MGGGGSEDRGVREVKGSDGRKRVGQTQRGRVNSDLRWGRVGHVEFNILDYAVGLFFVSKIMK